MDLISLLPSEVAQNIFKLLHVKDLCNCMTVCKSWRNLINCNYIWGSFYKMYGIEEILDNEEFSNIGIKSLGPLCSRAIELKKFLMSSAFNWRFRRSNNFYINLKFRQWKVACHLPYVAVFYFTANELHVFSCTRKSIELNDVIFVNNFSFNSCNYKSLISLKYIALGAYNITFIYKVIDGHFKQFKIIVLMESPIIFNVDDNYSFDVQKHTMFEYSVSEIILKDDILWLTNSSGIKHIINLNNDETEQMITPLKYTKVVPNSDFVINYLDADISFSDTNGSIVSYFTTTSRQVEKIFHMNTSIIVISFPEVLISHQYEIECYEIMSGKLLRKDSVSNRTKITLHPKKAIIYLLCTKPFEYSVTAVCIYTGKIIWNYEVSSKPHMYWGSFLHVISDRFLLVYPAPSSDDLYALFNLRGELLYESPFISGILLYFSDKAMLSKEEGRLHLSTFF